MSRRWRYLILAFGLMGAAARAQTPASTTPTEYQIYCSGTATTQAIRSDAHVISGPESDVKLVFALGDQVFLSRGADRGVKVGDQFEIIREESEQLRFPWFAWQESLMHAMGTYYADIGRVRVVSVQPKTSIAEIVLSCNYLQRGDMVMPFVPRPAPALKAGAPGGVAPAGDKAKAMIVFSKNFGEMAGAGKTVYVNLGSGQGVKVGDYFRVFKYQGEHDESVYNTRGNAYQMFGFGSTPQPYDWKDLPRDILGEGIVVRVSPSAATVLITNSQREMHVGDYVELE